MSLAASPGTESAELSCRRELRSRALVDPARHATLKRFGARSGNTNVIFAREASGKSRLLNLSAPTETRVDVPRTMVHQATSSRTSCPRGRSRAAVTEETTERMRGIASAAIATANPRIGRARQRLLSASDTRGLLVCCHHYPERVPTPISDQLERRTKHATIQPRTPPGQSSLFTAHPWRVTAHSSPVLTNCCFTSVAGGSGPATVGISDSPFTRPL